MTTGDGPAPDGRLVVIGSSAGGIEALSLLVNNLPPGFPAPIVIAQHLDPGRPSQLEGILRRHSSLPVVLVKEREHMRPGNIYVVPSNYHVMIQDGHVAIGEVDGNRPRPSVDLLLSTAAASYGENLIAVILTGSGSDGAAGAVEVKEAGGIVIIQNPQTARYPSMPMALPPTAVDHVVDLEGIAEMLRDLMDRQLTPVQPRGDARDPLNDILAIVTRQSSIDFRNYKPTTIMRRIGRRMAATHNSSLRDYESYLRQHPEEVGELVMAFLIKVTRFFRDPEAYSYLKDHILPALVEIGRAHGRVIRVWSAGCATGEEPYSLAMMLADMLGPEVSEWSIKIFATDIDGNAIDYARRGTYPENVLANLPRDYRLRFFERTDHGYRISKGLRQLVIFGQQDLSRGVPFPRCDLVICRNLLIYFKPDLQQHVLDMFAYSLSQTSGFLFLGQAETTRPSQAHFDLVNKKWKVYRCISAPLPLRGFVAGPAQVTSRQHEVRRMTGVTRQTSHADAAIPQPDVMQLRRFSEVILRNFPSGLVVIDRTYRILTSNAIARRLLSFREIVNEQDFLHTARGLPYNEIRGAIDLVFRERSSVTLTEIATESSVGTQSRFLTLTVTPVEGDNEAAELAVISVADATEQVQNRRRLEAAQAEQRQLVEELSAANKRLSEMNKDLQDANEELQTANEELMLTQEELQATNEEIESTNEELQATNEELETNNEELQATNEELETTNEELQARSTELQELTITLATERTRLTDMVELAPYNILVLRGPGLVVESYNPRFAALFGGRDLAGRGADDILTLEEMGNLMAEVREAYREDKPRTTARLLARLPAENGEPVESHFVYTIVPTHDNNGHVDGVVIYAEDVTAQVTREAEQQRERLRLLIENVEGVALGLYDARSSRLLHANSRFLEVSSAASGMPRDRVLGSTWVDLAARLLGEEADGLFRSVLDGREPVRRPEIRLALPPDNRETIWDVYLVPVPSEDASRVQYIAASAIEVSDQVHAREELERLDQMKDVFLSLASHELRTPLVPLTGYADMLTRLVARKEEENPPGWDRRIAEYTSRFQGQLRHLTRLVEDLFDVARIESGKFTLDTKEVDLVEVIDEAIEQARMLSPKHKITCAIEEKDRPLVVTGDKDRLIQVVGNLLQNATRYAPNSKKIDMKLRREAESNDGREMAMVEVRDYGPGIAEDDIRSIFTRFYQASRENRPAEGGLGLGLFISKGIVEQHGGTITVTSTVGKGSTFRISLPLANSPQSKDSDAGA